MPETSDLNVSNLNLPKVDLPKVDLPKVDLPKVDFPKVDFPKVDLPKVNMVGEKADPQKPEVVNPKTDTKDDLIKEIINATDKAKAEVVYNKIKNTSAEKEGEPEKKNDLRPPEKIKPKRKGLLNTIQNLFKKNDDKVGGKRRTKRKWGGKKRTKKRRGKKRRTR